ncbi:hypothetical protein [Bradyrhizobium sp. Ce-3]|uniref:hypothetical protein n=1 Tax=Bradyrhizobium sp. Ce-3 TaxID=2913970 RepID=UPI001FC83375|nr:hypothetical protein [Bradyrhizobium sp. Ce-3]
MLFSNFLPLDRGLAGERSAVLSAITADFQTAFPGLRFELRLDCRVINAQAIVLDGKPSVLVYGGLALHPTLAEASLTFVFLHEAGHHLGTGPRSPYNVTLACDCIADQWATTQGAQTLLRNTGRRLQIEQALDELHCLMSESEAAGPSSSQNVPLPCWNRCWLRRRQALGASLTSRPERCELLL